MQHTLGDKYNGLYCSIVMLVETTVGSENRVHIHLYVLVTKGLRIESTIFTHCKSERNTQ